MERSEKAFENALRNTDRRMRYGIVREMGRDHTRLSQKLISLLIADLDDPAKEMRIAVIRALQYTALPSVASALGRILECDQNHIVRSCAAYGLGLVGLPVASHVYASGLRDPSEVVRLAMCRSLCRTKDPCSAPLLLESLNDPSDDVRRWACEALIGLGVEDSRIADTLLSLGLAPDTRETRDRGGC